MRGTQKTNKMTANKPLLEVELTVPTIKVPQILSSKIFRGSASKIYQLQKWSRLGSILWVVGTAVGILGGHIFIEAGISSLGLVSLAMGIFRAP